MLCTFDGVVHIKINIFFSEADILRTVDSVHPTRKVRPSVPLLGVVGRPEQPVQARLKQRRTGAADLVMGDVTDTWNGTKSQQAITNLLGSDAHNGPDIKSKLMSIPSFAMGALFSFGSFRTAYVARRRGLIAFGFFYLGAFVGAGTSTLIYDRAGNMGADYAFAASLWTFIESRMIMHRMKTIPGAPSKREGYPLSMCWMANIAAASTLYHFTLSCLLRQRPAKDQLIARWGPRPKAHIGDD